MSANRNKLIMIVCLSLCFGIILCFLGYTRITSLFNMMEVGSKGQVPVRSLRITIDPSQRDKLFAQMQKFADENAIKILIRDVEVKEGPSGKGFFIEMHRSDIQIISIGEPSAPIIISIHFYDEDSAHPARKETIDELFNDLKSFISEIPNITITEEK